jgi:hypothetical protein
LTAESRITYDARQIHSGSPTGAEVKVENAQESNAIVYAHLTERARMKFQADLGDLANRILKDKGLSGKVAEDFLKTWVRAHEHTQAEKLQYGLSEAYIHTYPHLRLGGIYRIKEGAQYTVTKPGTMVVVRAITIGATGVLSPPEKPEVVCLALDKNGRVSSDEDFVIAVDDIEPVAENEFVAIYAMWGEPVPEHTPFKDGTWVQLKQDVTQIFSHPFYGTRTMFLSCGLAGIVDTPDTNAGGSAKNVNKPDFIPPTIEVEFGWNVELHHACGKSEYLDLNHYRRNLPLAGYGYKYKVYIPEHRGYIEIDRSFLEARPFKDMALNDVIMAPVTRRKLMSAISDTSADLREWGLENFTKGKGTIILGHGGPGLGKTATAEAVAEHLRRPLYIVENNMFGNDAASFEKGLKEINERADRWNAVILWDECEVFLQHRGADPVQNARITAALRSLEAFEGVMFLTTNRPGMLDEAITNRVHTKLYYGPFTTEQKREVWLKLKPAQMNISDFEEVLASLVQLDLNGRDIKTLLRNTGKVAASEGLKTVPGQYLLDEAKDLLESATQLLNGEAEAELHKNRKHSQNGKTGSALSVGTARA